MAATSFPRWYGDGQGAFVWELAKAIRKQGIQVSITTLHSPGTKIYEIFDDIEVYRSRYWWPENTQRLHAEGGGLPISLRKYRLARIQLPFFAAMHTSAIIKRAKTCDLIHAHWTLSAAAALVGQPIHRKPIIVTVQGSDVLQVPKHPIGAWATRTVLNRCSRVTALTQALKSAAIRAGAFAEKIEVISNGVDFASLSPATSDSQNLKTNRENIILFVGSLIQRKGVKDLLEALSLLPDTTALYRVVLIGEGPEEAGLRAQIHSLGKEHVVDFMGFLPHSEVLKWMKRSRVLVLPSYEEGQGAVLLEALACGTPIVASGVDGIGEVVSSDVGILTPPGDPQLLADALHRLLTQDSRWIEMSRAASKRAVELYDWDQIARRYITLYEQILSTKLSSE